MPRLLFAAGVLASAAAFEDGQAFVQSATRPHGSQPSLKDILGMMPEMGNAISALVPTAPPMPETKLCTKTDLDTFTEQMTVYSKKAGEISKMQSERAWQKFNTTLSTVRAKLEDFAQPFVKSIKDTFGLVKEAYVPLVVEDIKFFMMSIAKPSTPYPSPPSSAAIEQEEANVKKRLEASAGREIEIVGESIRSFDQLVDARVETAFPKLAPLLPKAKSKLPADMAGISEYMVHFIYNKAGPVILAEMSPELGILLAVLNEMPKDSEGKAEFFRTKLKPLLPKSCGEVKDAFKKMEAPDQDFGSIFGTMMGLQNLVESCVAEVLPERRQKNKEELEPLPTLPPPPTRECETCHEHITAKLMAPSAPKSCVADCSPLLMSCIGGVNDGCIHSAGPCVKCFQDGMSRLDQCEGSQDHADMAARLGVLSLALSSGSVEATGVESFAKSIASVLMKA